MLAASLVATLGCGSAGQYPSIGSVVGKARADQLSFASEYQEKGLAFRGTVQQKGLKASTAAGIELERSGFGVVGQARRVNVNYGYLFLGEGQAEDKRALCLFEPEELKRVAALQVGQPVTVTCLFSKFVGGEAQPTPVFSGCSVLE